MGSWNYSPKMTTIGLIWLWNQNDSGYSQSWIKRDMTAITVWRTTQIATILSLRSWLKWFDLPVGLVILLAKVNILLKKLSFVKEVWVNESNTLLMSCYKVAGSSTLPTSSTNYPNRVVNNQLKVSGNGSSN